VAQIEPVVDAVRSASEKDRQRDAGERDLALGARLAPLDGGGGRRSSIRRLGGCGGRATGDATRSSSARLMNISGKLFWLFG
jgi:hypothetical protein